VVGGWVRLHGLQVAPTAGAQRIVGGTLGDRTAVLGWAGGSTGGSWE